MIKTFVAALLVLAAPAYAQDSIKIGLIVDRIGFAKAWSEPITQGAVYAARELNAKGGLLGRKVELLIEDDQSKPEISATAARKLDEGRRGVHPFAHAYGRRAAGADRDRGDEDAAPRALAHGRHAHHPDQQPELLADGAARLDADRDAPLLRAAEELQARRRCSRTTRPSARRPRRRSRPSSTRPASQVVADEMLPSGAQSAEAQMQKVRAAKPDAIFLATLLTPENLLVLRYYRSNGMKTPLHRQLQPRRAGIHERGERSARRPVFVDVWDPAKPQVKAFVAGYTKEMGSEPHNLMGYGYDGVMLAADAIRRAGGTDKDKVRQAMQATRATRACSAALEATYGFAEGRRIGFDPQGMVVRMYEGDRQGRVLHVGTK